MANFSKLFSAELEGINAHVIEVETDVSVGLHSFTIVGLADKALSEAKERVNAALKNSGVKPPSRENRRIVVNLAPADVQKTGSQYDLAIALGYLVATGQIKEFETAGILFIGELSLDGALRPVSGVLNIAKLAKQEGFSCLIVPRENAAEAALISGLQIISARNILELIAHLEEKNLIPPQPETEAVPQFNSTFLTVSDIKGQESAKRALSIAAAGGHNLLMSGPPGTGKTMLAQALTSILPNPEREEIIEITQIYSAAGLLGVQPFVAHRPFRSPHQTASPAAVIGGGSSPRPGEISLAHRGVLFLDELPEFRRDLLESLRQPLESGKVVISRAKSNLVFPASFILVAAMNPCPCGYYQDEEKTCVCSANDILRYQKKVSGPLLDRIDLQISVPRISLEELKEKNVGLGENERLRKKVLEARERQRDRFVDLKEAPIFTNSEMNSKQVDSLVRIDKDAENFIKAIFEKSLISARGYYRILKTAQTIADLDSHHQVGKADVAEAFSYRLRENLEV